MILDRDKIPNDWQHIIAIFYDKKTINKCDKMNDNGEKSNSCYNLQ